MAVVVRSLREEDRLMRSRTLLTVLMAAIAIVIVWAMSRRAAPPQVPFAKVTRETVISTLSTNGKVEPIEWASARAERAGLIRRVLIERGQFVEQDAPLVELDSREASAQLASAEAQIGQAKAQIQALNSGGSSVERAQIDGDLERARLDLQSARHQAASLEHLVEKQAATKVELDNMRQHVEQLQLQIQALEQRRAALVAPTDKEIAKSRLEQAEASANLAQSTLALSTIRTPISGTVYQFDLRVGAFVNAGDLVANIGRLERVRVIVYVDEPELGRVREGMPVTITWDAKPDRQWKGVVDKLPTQVVPLGTRQVGEVSCTIRNPDRDLIPGTNINAEIQSSVVGNALAIPKVAIRRENGQTGVLVLSDGHVAWRPVKLGVSSYIKTEVVSGLGESDSVALPTEKPIKNGSKVDPVYP
jgi:HlyD family secretion protein